MIRTTFNRPRETLTQPVRQVVPSQVIREAEVLRAEIAQEFNFLPALPNKAVSVSNPIRTLVQAILEEQRSVLSAHDIRVQARDHRAQILRQKINAQDTTDLRRLFRRFTKGSSAYALDVLAALAELASEDQALRDLGYGEESLFNFARQYEHELLASLHINQEVQKHVLLGADGAQLKGLYEEAVVQTGSVMQALRQLGLNGGMNNVLQWRTFLNNATAADLGALDVGADKAHLEQVLRELKGLRIFNMLTAALKQLEEKRLKGAQAELFAQTLDYIEQPYMVLPNFERWIAACVTQEQILFFQDYRNIYNAIPDDAYIDEQQKSNSKRILQEKIDTLIYSE